MSFSVQIDDPSAHNHEHLRTHTYWDRSTQSDIPCPRRDCDGVMRVTSFYAPDVRCNWRKCCCCGWDEIGGDLRRPIR